MCAAARTRGIAPVIPHKANEKNAPAFFAKTLYKARARIEQGFGRLKRFKRVALRCEKTAQNFRSIVSFAAGLCLIKFVHTASVLPNDGLTQTTLAVWSGMRRCGSILKSDGSLVDASQMAWYGVRHCRALRCLAKL